MSATTSSLPASRSRRGRTLFAVTISAALTASSLAVAPTHASAGEPGQPAADASENLDQVEALPTLPASVPDTEPDPDPVRHLNIDLDGTRLSVALEQLRTLGYPEVRIDRKLGGGWVNLDLGTDVDVDTANELADELTSAGAVSSAEPDEVMHPSYVPDDSRYDEMWHLHDRPYAMNAQGAWDITRGSVDTVIAVVDSGELRHPDMVDRLLPGVNMISSQVRAGTGTETSGARSTDPSDLGDACEGRRAEPSWHGAHVAGTIASTADNATGVVGVNHHAKIQHVRALGRCGGITSDTADGIRWAAGASVSGVPDNETPADIINLSFGSAGRCSTMMQSAIDEANDRGAIVVAAAGNDAHDLDDYNYRPADCDGVIVVSATNNQGQLARYSNWGSNVDVGAPAGEASNLLETGRVLSISSSRTTNTDRPVTGQWAYRWMAGTSAASPNVAGVVSLMLARDPSLTTEEVRTILRDTAGPFGSPGNLDTPCSNGSTAGSREWCGHGIVDAKAAVEAVDGPAAPGASQLTAALASAGRMQASWNPPSLSPASGPVSHSVFVSDTTRCSHSVGTAVYDGASTDVTVNRPGNASTYRVCHYTTDGNGQVSLRSNTVRLGTNPPSNPPSNPTPPAPTFSDVSPGGSHSAAISWMAQQGITTGCSTPGAFCPDEAVTREQMATFLTRALSLPTGPGSRFSDVTAGSTHAPSIEAMYRANITRGCSIPGAFCPRDTVTREQMASFIARAQGYSNGPVSMFRDVRAGSSHAGPIGAMYRENITRGCSKGNDHYCPTDAVTRGQMASFLHRALA